MSLVKILDFCEALAVKEGTVRSKISRGQLVCNEKRLIDTQNPINFIYILEVNGGNQTVFEKYHVVSSTDTNIRKKVSPKTKNTLNNVKTNALEKTPIKKAVIPEKPKNKKPNEIKGSVKVAPSHKTTISEEKKEVIKKEITLTPEEKKKKRFEEKMNTTFLEFERRKKEADVQLQERKAELAQWELEKKAGNTLPLNMIENVIAINLKAIFKNNLSLANNVAYVIVNQLGGTKEDLHTIRTELENVFDKTVKDIEKKTSVDIEKLIDEYSEIRSRGERKI
jgi:hypothetical protein